MNHGLLGWTRIESEQSSPWRLWLASFVRAGLHHTVDRGPAFRLPSLLIFEDKDELGRAAAAQAVEIIVQAIAKRGRARVLIATGNSQIETIAALVQNRLIDWSKVDCFHLDEYVGLPAAHPASFRNWVRTRFAEKARGAKVHYIEGDAADLAGHLRDYGAKLFSAPVDLAFVGFGENGHVAFNDPPVADFDDPQLMKEVELDERCRRQQVGEGHFPNLQSVPTKAVTVTCTGLMQAEHWICCVPDARKAEAVQGALEGPIEPACPASLVRRHPHATVYLDSNSATLLSPELRKRARSA